MIEGRPTHAEMVAVLAKPGAEIARELTANTDNYQLLKETCQSVIQASERMDIVKKQVVYNKPGSLRPAAHRRKQPSITPDQAHLLHMAIGIFGEAGEVLQAIYEHVFNDAALDLENVIEESGDSEFYWEGLRQKLGVTRGEVLEHNVTKLGKRYAGYSYSDDAAQIRVDKVSPETTPS